MIAERVGRPVKTMAEHQDDFRRDIKRALFHVRCSMIEVENLRNNRLVRSCKALKSVSSYSEEVSDWLLKTTRKLTWFTGVVKKILGEKDNTFSDFELDPNGHKVCNIAQLTEWVADSNIDHTNAVDFVVNGARRRELFLNAWKEAVRETTDRPWSEYDDIKFDSWYRTQFPR